MADGFAWQLRRLSTKVDDEFDEVHQELQSHADRLAHLESEIRYLGGRVVQNKGPRRGKTPRSRSYKKRPG